MPTTKPVDVKSLALDLKNFRTVAQADEDTAVRAMISIHPEWFWALTDSLLEDGYLPTESIIVQKGKKGALTVKEGNRRVAALKLVLKILGDDGITVPSHITEKINTRTKQWKSENRLVPCTIYEVGEEETVDRIVTLTHGKAEQAGRDQWNALARARHNRAKNPTAEPGLDLLEKYLEGARNADAEQKERWGGDYNLTVVDEMMKRYSKRFGASTARDMADKYPKKVTNKQALDTILRDTGLEKYGFKQVRDTKSDPLQSIYGVPPLAVTSTGGNKGTTSASTSGGGGTADGNTTTTATTTNTTTTAANAKATNDPKSVTSILKAFKPKGNNREKVVTLLNEAQTLKIGSHPHAFCFLLRSMFELSAKAYCKDHAADKLSAIKSSGEDRHLVEVLREITEFLMKGPDGKRDKNLEKVYHGPMAELAKPSGFLSVTSLNQLIHNPKFTVDDTHISTLFGNIFPLLEAMNS